MLIFCILVFQISARHYQQMCENRWSWQISCHASRSWYQMAHNMSNLRWRLLSWVSHPFSAKTSKYGLSSVLTFACWMNLPHLIYCSSNRCTIIYNMLDCIKWAWPPMPAVFAKIGYKADSNMLFWPSLHAGLRLKFAVTILQTIQIPCEFLTVQPQFGLLEWDLCWRKGWNLLLI